MKPLTKQRYLEGVNYESGLKVIDNTGASYKVDSFEGYVFTSSEMEEFIGEIIESSCIMGIQYANDKSSECEINFRNSKQQLIKQLLI